MKRQLSALALSLPLLLSACVDEREDYVELDDPYTFDGVEIEEIIAEQPEAAFRVDLIGAASYRFDQREAVIDFERVFVHTPGREVFTLAEVAQTEGLDLSWASWRLDHSPDFRAAALGSCAEAIDLMIGGRPVCFCVLGEDEEL